jgi:hypothetical protein
MGRNDRRRTGSPRHSRRRREGRFPVGVPVREDDVDLVALERGLVPVVRDAGSERVDSRDSWQAHGSKTRSQFDYLYPKVLEYFTDRRARDFTPDVGCTGFRGQCGNAYIREERLADLLGAVVQGIQIPTEATAWIAEGLRDSEGELEQAREQAVARCAQRQRPMGAKSDRGYEDYLEGRISEAFWTRKSQEWESILVWLTFPNDPRAAATSSHGTVWRAGSIRC